MLDDVDATLDISHNRVVVVMQRGRLSAPAIYHQVQCYNNIALRGEEGDWTPPVIAGGEAAMEGEACSFIWFHGHRNVRVCDTW